MENYLQVHYAIKTIRHGCTVLSILFAVPALLVVGLCAKRVTKRYSLCISIIVILGVANDIVLQLVWDPLMLGPSLCFLRENPLLLVPGGANLYYELWALIVGMNTPVFYACFMERHQAVQAPGSRFAIPLPIRHLIFVVIVLIGASCTYLLIVAEMSLDDEQILLQTLVVRWPTVDVMRAKCYDDYRYLFFDFNCVGGLLVATAFVAVISLHTFAMIRKTSTLSDAMKSFNASMTRVLIIQATVPLVFIAFPLILSLIAILTDVQSPLHVSLCHLFMAAHSPCHSFVLVTVTPMYRKKLLQIARFNSRNRSVTITQRGETANATFST